jgi:translation initiation factor 3 subunit I
VCIVKFNRDGDLFFTGSLDGTVTAFWTDPVERLGTYKSEGAVKAFSVSEDSKVIIIGSAINGIFVFEVETGVLLTTLPALQLKQLDFAAGSKSFFLIHNRSKHTIVDIIKSSVFGKKYEDLDYASYKENEKITLVDSETTYTRGAWGYLNRTLVLGTNQGFIEIFDTSNKQKVLSIHPHTNIITDIRFTLDFSLMITASRDSYCNVFDPSEFQVVRVYNAQRPLNSAAISPLVLTDNKYHAVIGGGQETRDVTTTKAEQGGFEITVFNMMFGNEVGALKGHFGPVHSVDIHPKGTIIISGSEDGHARYHKLDNDYFTNKN